MANFAPSTPNPYGYDLWWLQDLDPGMREVGGNLALAQWVLRCITTPTGQLLDDPGFGYDVAQWLNADVEIGSPQISQINSGVTKALLRDQRILSCSVSTTFFAVSGLLVLVIQITGAGGPFSLTVAVSAVTVQLLQPIAG